MPIISVFLGLTIRMYFGDHPPPHIHVSYQGFEALVRVDDGTLIAGDLPRRPLKLLREWLDLHRDDIVRNWKRAERMEPLERIRGLDAD
jgi:hypothetical protein